MRSVSRNANAVDMQRKELIMMDRKERESFVLSPAAVPHITQVGSADVFPTRPTMADGGHSAGERQGGSWCPTPTQRESWLLASGWPDGRSTWSRRRPQQTRGLAISHKERNPRRRHKVAIHSSLPSAVKRWGLDSNFEKRRLRTTRRRQWQ